MVNATLYFIIYETVSDTLLAVGISVLIVVVIGMCIGCVCIWRYRKSQNTMTKFNFFKSHNLMDIDRKKRSNITIKEQQTRSIYIEELEIGHIMMFSRHDQWEIDRESLLVQQRKVWQRCICECLQGHNRRHTTIASISESLNTQNRSTIISLL